jgi:hypothetical protein
MSFVWRLEEDFNQLNIAELKVSAFLRLICTALFLDHTSFILLLKQQS